VSEHETSDEVATSDEVPTSDEVSPVTGFTVGSGPQSVSMVQVGGYAYPLHRDARCPVCRHHDRLRIERMIMDGYTYKSIASVVNKQRHPQRWVPADEREHDESHSDYPVLTPAGLSAHVEGLHMELVAATMRLAADERLVELGMDPHEIDKAVLPDGMALLRATVARAFQRISTGEISPSLQDGVRAAQALHAMESVQSEGGPDDMAAIEEAFRVFWEGVVQITTPEQQGQLALWVQNHPKLAALRARAEQRDELGAVDYG